ncbi:MAG: MmcQ/YjbR family DNA-binding protein [Ignavibacteriae bacterium]|nr:MmcQ/YjbR family DNA-binding protein [Ignavibacteriota bacterium]
MSVTIEHLREYCLKKHGAITEEFPFGSDVLVFKVYGKIFVLARLEQRPLSINLKCDPERAIEWRERYEAVQPGYHMNKKFWNTVVLDDSIPSRVILTMIDHSYDEVVKRLPKKIRL